jgi:hypothetical protein
VCVWVVCVYNASPTLSHTHTHTLLHTLSHTYTPYTELLIKSVSPENTLRRPRISVMVYGVDCDAIIDQLTMLSQQTYKRVEVVVGADVCV